MNNIKLVNISKSFGEHKVLNDFSADIPINKITCIIGASGCGKTTLLRILANLDKDYTGNVVNGFSDVSVEFQENRLIPWLTGYENMLFSVKHMDYFNELESDINYLIKSVKLKKHIHKLPAELSGGMQRRVSLIRAFINRAPLLLLDEPFTGLDKKTKMSIATNLLTYAIDNNRTVVMISHDENIINLAHNKIIMK